jgi:hypothetical protein
MRTSTRWRTPGALAVAAVIAAVQALAFGGAGTALAWLIGAAMGLTGHALLYVRLAADVAGNEGGFV